jgi:hypothetical protein
LDHAFTGEILRQPYPQGCAILAEAAGRATLTDKRYQKEVHLVRRFVDEQGGGGIDLERLFQASLVGNLLFQIIQGIDPRFPTRSPMDPFRQTPHLFLSSLAQLIADAPLSALQKYFSFSGLEHLRVARKERGGIIIVTAPGSVTRLAMAVLPRNLEIESIPVIGPGEAKMKRSTRPADHRVDASPKSQADGDASRESHRLLEQHKLVQFFGDLNDPRAGHPVIVAGRRYKLRSDFAELACDTGATVIPLFATLRKNAHIRTTILPSFDVLGSSRAEKIDSLLHQVAEFISDGWKTAPESLLWSGMVRHFKQPMA